MRIISKFKDYYDSALSYGVDKELIYKRETEIFDHLRDYKDGKKIVPDYADNVAKSLLELTRKLPDSISHFRDHRRSWKRNDWKIEKNGFVGFCGKLYPFVVLENSCISSGTYGVLTSEVQCYNIDQFVNTIPEGLLKQKGFSSENLTESILDDYVSDNTWFKPLNVKTWENLISELNTMDFSDMFITLKVPVFSIVRNYNWYDFTLNPPLKDLRFQTVKNPVEAFQEISMFIGNQLVSQNDPTGNISDNDMRDEKGFNEWSFRRHKDESKKNKK